MKARFFLRSLGRSIGFGPTVTDLIAPAVGILAVGMLAGAGIALLFAPSSGSSLRADLGRTLGGVKSKILTQGAASMNNHANAHGTRAEQHG